MRTEKRLPGLCKLANKQRIAAVHNRLNLFSVKKLPLLIAHWLSDRLLQLKLEFLLRVDKPKINVKV